MPVEIRELVLRARVEDAGPAQDGDTQTEVEALRKALLAEVDKKIAAALRARTGR